VLPVMSATSPFKMETEEIVADVEELPPLRQSFSTRIFALLVVVAEVSAPILYCIGSGKRR
jgi:hypothetical protein